MTIFVKDIYVGKMCPYCEIALRQIQYDIIDDNSALVKVIVQPMSHYLGDVETILWYCTTSPQDSGLTFTVY